MTTSREINQYFRFSAISVGAIFGVIAFGTLELIASGTYKAFLVKQSEVEYSKGLTIEQTKNIFQIDANLSMLSLGEAIRVVREVENRPIHSVTQPFVDPKYSTWIDAKDNPYCRDTSKLVITVGKMHDGGAQLFEYHLHEYKNTWKIINKSGPHFIDR